MKSAYAADGGINFSVSGVTALLRGEILRDPAFQHAFVNDVWMGHRQNSGDDSFITRWVLFHHLIGCQHQEDGLVPTKWRLGMQLTTEAEVGTSIMPDSRFAGQVKRWYRSGLRHRLMCLCFEPGIREMWRTCPYMTRKMVEGMLNPVLLWVRLYCLYKTALIYPWVALPILGIKLYRYINGVRGFARECPWARRCLWAAVLIDRLYLVSDWYCWATLGTEAWMSRRKVDEENDIALSDTSDEKEE